MSEAALLAGLMTLAVGIPSALFVILLWAAPMPKELKVDKPCNDPMCNCTKRSDG